MAEIAEQVPEQAQNSSWGGDVVAVGGKVAMMPISLGTADFLETKQCHFLTKAGKIFNKEPSLVG
jgi:hypothetical protein